MTTPEQLCMSDIAIQQLAPVVLRALALALGRCKQFDAE